MIIANKFQYTQIALAKLHKAPYPYAHPGILLSIAFFWVRDELIVSLMDAKGRNRKTFF